MQSQILRLDELRGTPLARFPIMAESWLTWKEGQIVYYLNTLFAHLIVKIHLKKFGRFFRQFGGVDLSCLCSAGYLPDFLFAQDLSLAIPHSHSIPLVHFLVQLLA